MHRNFFKAAAAIAMLAVIIGAFGAHLLKSFLSPQELESIQTAATFQMSHAIALFLTGILYRLYRRQKIIYAGYLFFSGIILFSGSIYLRILLSNLGLPKANVAAIITPFGGVSFILGWFLLMVAISPSKKKHQESGE
jgi:uncharacterized membrane protein YgdD (TMEM256/DUF423 family)